MNFLRRATLRLRAIFGRRTLESDMQAEMREHLARATDRLVGRGMSPNDARLAARREFGNVTVLQEQGRDARGARWIDELSGDLRFAFRYFSRHKATVAITVVVLALGTGGNTMIFSTFQSQFFRPAPAVPNDRAHTRIWALERAKQTARWESRNFTRPELAALAEHREIFSAVAAWTSDDIVLDGGDSTGARGVGAQFVTPNYFATLGVPLAGGQGFAPDVGANGAPDMTAVMSYNVAALLYGDAVNAIGRRILVNELPLRVVGVAPPKFQGALHNMGDPALWIPLSARADLARISPKWLDDQASLSLFARLAPGASRDRATALARQVVVASLPDSASRVGMARTAQVLALREPPPGDEGHDMVVAFTVMMVIGVLILLVAWTNVSSLMVAAAVGRRHEIAVRLSLGASRTRLLRQLITESTVLGLVGSLAGLLLAWLFLTWQAKTAIDGFDITPDVGTFVFVLIMALATGILFGLSPALHATRNGVANALRESGTAVAGRSRLQRTFVALQIVLSQPLLVMLGTLLSLVLAEYRPLAHETSQRVISVGLRPLSKTGAPSQRAEAVDGLIPRIAGRPEVVSAVPAAAAFAVRGVVRPPSEARNAQSDSVPTIVHVEGVAPGWFSVIDVPIILGRDVSLGDTATTDHRIVVGSDLARKLWGGANPVGRTLASPPVPGLGPQDSITMTVVGVYDATRRLPGMTWGGYTARGSEPSRVYTARGKQWRHDAILVRTRGPSEPFVPELHRFVRAAAPSIPVTSMMTLAQVDAEQYRQTLRGSLLTGAGGALALLLASLGLYGVVSLSVQQRTREIGIRIAVGAEPARVARMFLASGVRVSVTALFVGLPLSVAALRLGMSQGVILAPEANPYLIGGVIAVLLVSVASAATWIPARRAARVDPAATLRVE